MVAVEAGEMTVEVVGRRPVVMAEGEMTVVAGADGTTVAEAGGMVDPSAACSIFNSNSCTDTWQTDMRLHTYVGHTWFVNRS